MSAERLLNSSFKLLLRQEEVGCVGSASATKPCKGKAWTSHHSSSVGFSSANFPTKLCWSSSVWPERWQQQVQVFKLYNGKCLYTKELQVFKDFNLFVVTSERYWSCCCRSQFCFVSGLCTLFFQRTFLQQAQHLPYPYIA